MESPFPKAKFEKKHNVENVICGIDSSAVIVEHIQRQKKQKKKERKTISL